MSDAESIKRRARHNIENEQLFLAVAVLAVSLIGVVVLIRAGRMSPPLSKERRFLPAVR
jgi:hypothetical protein